MLVVPFLIALAACGGEEDGVSEFADALPANESVALPTGDAAALDTSTATPNSAPGVDDVLGPSSVRDDVRYALNKGTHPDVKISLDGGKLDVLLESCAVAQSSMLDVGIARGLLTSTTFLPFSEGAYPADEATIILELVSRMDGGARVPYYQCGLDAQSAGGGGGFHFSMIVIREPQATNATPYWCSPDTSFPDVEGFDWCIADIGDRPLSALLVHGQAQAVAIAFTGVLTGDTYTVPDRHLILADVASAWIQDAAFWVAAEDGLPTCGDERFGDKQWWGCGG